MKITEIIICSVHTTHPRNFNFARIDTDQGIYGVGELFCMGADVAVLEMVKYVSVWVLGMNPLDRERIQKRIINYSRFIGGSILYTADATIDLALGTLQGKLPACLCTYPSHGTPLFLISKITRLRGRWCTKRLKRLVSATVVF